MSDNHSDDLHDVLAELAENGNVRDEEHTPLPADAPTEIVDLEAESAAAQVAVAQAVDGALSPTSNRPRPGRKAPTAPLKLALALILLLVGALLLAWAVYGVLILTGVSTVDRDNARFMAGLMAFAAGPIGLILTAAGAVTLRKRLRGSR